MRIIKNVWEYHCNFCGHVSLTGLFYGLINWWIGGFYSLQYHTSALLWRIRTFQMSDMVFQCIVFKVRSTTTRDDIASDLILSCRILRITMMPRRNPLEIRKEWRPSAVYENRLVQEEKNSSELVLKMSTPPFIDQSTEQWTRAHIERVWVRYSGILLELMEEMRKWGRQKEESDSAIKLVRMFGNKLTATFTQHGDYGLHITMYHLLHHMATYIKYLKFIPS